MNLIWIAAIALSKSLTYQDVKVTYETPALRAEKVVIELSRLSGTTLSVSPATKDEFLILSVKDVPLKDLMDKIAAATSAEWIAEPSGWRLVRSPKLIQEQDRASAAKTAGRIAEAQTKLRLKAAKEGEFDSAKARAVMDQIEAHVREQRAAKDRDREWEALDRFSSSLPIGRLTTAIACALDPKVLASLPRGSMTVFSTAPNPIQRPLPPAVQPAIQKYIKERKLILPLIGEFDPQTHPYLPFSISATRSGKALKDSNPAKCLVTFKMRDSSNYCALTVTLANAEGQIIDENYLNLDLMSPFSGPMPAPPPNDPTGEAPLPISERSKTFNDLMMATIAKGGDPEDIPALPEPLKAVFLNPEEHVAAELLLSDLFMGYAKAKGQNVVARVGDVTGIFTMMLFGGGAPSARQFLERMRSPQFDSVVEESPGWIVMRSSDPVEERNRVFDRPAFGKILRELEKGNFSIEAMASFAITTPDQFERIVALLPMMFVAPAAGRAFERAPWEILRFHGHLTQGQRQTLEAGQAIPFGQMTPPQKKIFHRIVYWDVEGLSKTERRNGPPISVEQNEEFAGQNIRSNPTERYPNGVPPQAVLRVGISSGAIIAARGTYRQHPTSREFPVDQLAWQLFQQERPLPDGEMRPQYTEFTYMQQRKLDYFFAVDDKLGFGGELKEPKSRNKPVSSPDKLPPEVWAQVKAELEKLAKSAKPPTEKEGVR